MAIEDFTLVQLKAKTIYYVIWDLGANFVWDQADNTFKALGVATSPGIATVVEAVHSGARISTYNARIELNDVHPGPRKSFYVAAYFQAGAAPDPLTDRPAGYLNVAIDRGTLALSQDDVANLIENPSVGVGSERVDQDYGGANNLCYTLNGIPVDNAEILVFLESDFLACNRGSEYVIAASRTKADGSWEKALMLDPARYVIQFHKQQVTGPDAYTLVVSANPAEISVTPLAVESCGTIPPPPPEPEPEPCVTEGLDAFGGDGLVLVDQDYGGIGNLCYLLDGEPVAYAEILLFDAASYNAGNRQNKFAIVASRQLPDGKWEQPVKVDPGEYIIQFHRQGVAGPDAYPLTVTA